MQVSSTTLWVSIVICMLMIMLLVHSLNAIRQMLRICDEFATDFDNEV